MNALDFIKGKMRERKAYKKLIGICSFEANNGAPYNPDVGFAFKYLEAGEYEQYFTDSILISKKKLQEQRTKVI